MPVDNLEVVRDESLIWARGTPRQSTFVRMHTHMATGLVHGVRDHAQPWYIPNLCVYVCDNRHSRDKWKGRNKRILFVIYGKFHD